MIADRPCLVTPEKKRPLEAREDDIPGVVDQAFARFRVRLDEEPAAFKSEDMARILREYL